MELDEKSRQTAILLSTGFVSLFSGFLLGVYAIRGYLISPALADERRRYHKDPVESEESDIDEDDTILDHAPNWANGEEADKRDGLRSGESKKSKESEDAGSSKPSAAVSMGNPNEECKLVLVVRTDLGMTKGERPQRLRFCPGWHFRHQQASKIPLC